MANERPDSLNIGVDSGTIWIGDPCYLIGKIKDQDDWVAAVDERYPGGESPDDAMPWSGGVWFKTYYGDGIYTVEVERDSHGRVMSLSLSFVDAVTEEDEFEPDELDG